MHSEELAAKPRSPDVVWDALKHRPQREKAWGRAAASVHAQPSRVRAGTRRPSSSAGEEGPWRLLYTEGLSGEVLDTSGEVGTGRERRPLLGCSL